jgi:medium-chain acyl-[acyl-carrier-protein] hydrolase
MTPWYVRKARQSDAPLRLICLPYAGGSAAIYRDWSLLLAPRIEVLAIELPGHGRRRDEEPFTAVSPLVDALASALLPDLNKPFAIFGHSMGALLGYELARRLYIHVGLQPRRLIVSGNTAPGIKTSSQIVHNLPDKEFIAELARLNGTPGELLGNAELMQLALPLLRADFHLNETYQHRPFPILTCPVSAYGGMSDDDVSADALAAWKHVTRGPFIATMFEGDHFFIHTATTLILQQIESDLQATQ